MLRLTLCCLLLCLISDLGAQPTDRPVRTLTERWVDSLQAFRPYEQVTYTDLPEREVQITARYDTETGRYLPVVWVQRSAGEGPWRDRLDLGFNADRQTYADTLLQWKHIVTEPDCMPLSWRSPLYSGCGYCPDWRRREFTLLFGEDCGISAVLETAGGPQDTAGGYAYHLLRYSPERETQLTYSLPGRVPENIDSAIAGRQPYVSETFFDAAGRIVRRYTELVDFGFEGYDYVYDEDGLLQQKDALRRQWWDSLIVCRDREVYSYLRNAAGQIVQREQISYYPSCEPHSGADTSYLYYSYYCDGALRSVTATDAGRPSYRTWYYYEHPADCDPPVAADLLVYPNPTTGLLQLQSEVLGRAPLQIELFDTAGRLLATWQRNERGGHTSIDLSALSPGVFLLRLQSAGQTVVRRVIRQ